MPYLYESSDFFSFGTNDLTQMTYGLSRDDAEELFLKDYIDQRIFPSDPFQTLDQVLLIPRTEQGTLTGDLAFLTEIVAIALIGTCGVLSDRIGRRPIIIAGLLFMALAYALYPLATSIPELAVYRAIYAIGIAAGTGMMVTLDHLEGLLFVDHISALKRSIILRRLTKQKKADKSDVWIPKLRTAGATVAGLADEEEPARAL